MECPQTPRRWPAAVAAAAVAVGVLGLGAAGPAVAAVPAYGTPAPVTVPAALLGVDGLAVGTAGTYVLDAASKKVALVDGSGAVLATSAAVDLSAPTDIAVSATKVYIADPGANRVVSLALPLTTSSAFTVEAGRTDRSQGTPPVGSTVTATSVGLKAPRGVAVDGNGVLYIADTGNGLVEKVDGTDLTVVAGGGTTAPTGTAAPPTSLGLTAPADVATAGTAVFVAEGAPAGRVDRLDSTGLRLLASVPGAASVGASASVLTVAAGTTVLALDPATGAAASSPLVTGMTAADAVDITASGVVWAGDSAGTSSKLWTVSPASVATAPVITSPSSFTEVTGRAMSRSLAASGSPTAWEVRSATPAAPWLSVGAATGVLSGTPVSGTYTVVVRASNTAGYYDKSITLSVGSVPATLTAKPAATAGQGSATVTWTAPTASAATAEAVTGYVVTPTAGGAAGTPRSVAAGSLSTTFTGLKAGTAYTFTVAATNAFGTAAASPASAAVTPYGGIAAPGPGLTRYQGGNRVTTAVRVSQQLFPDAGSARAVVVASSTSYADSLAGARLAAAVGAPLLLTDPLALNPEVAAEVGRVLAVPATTSTSAASTALAAADAGTTAAKPTATGTVYLLGGTSAVSAAAETALKAVSSKYTVTRLSGADRYETAVKIAAQTAVDDPVPGAPIYVASGANYPDGLAVAALASRTGGVVLLTQGPTMPAATLTYLQTYDPNSELLVAVGGPAAAATTGHGGERAIVGADRYDTARLVAARFTAAPGSARVDDVGLATGTNWPDALAGAAAMGNLDGPLLLTPPDALSPAVGSALTALSKSGRPTSALVFGGATVVSSSTADAFAAQVAG